MIHRPSAPDRDTTLLHYPWIVVRFRCHYCERAGDSRLAALAARYGMNATLGDLLSIFVGRCPWNPHSPLRKPQKYGMKCGAYCPDIGRAGPPDLPPAMGGLTLIDGGKADKLPAKRVSGPGRRRVGAADDE